MLSAFAARKKVETPGSLPITADSSLELNSQSQPAATQATQAQNLTNSKISQSAHVPNKRKQIQNDMFNHPSKRKKKNVNFTGSTTALATGGSKIPSSVSEDHTYEDRTPIAISVPISRDYSPSEPVRVEDGMSGILNQPTLISTFQPLLGHNVFFESQDHSSSDPTPIFTSTASSSIPASPSKSVVYLIFKPEDTLSFLGTVRLTVLQGSILLFGSPLYASPVVHSVFAPKSYPVATISVISESSDGYSSASKSSSPSDRIEASTLPQNIRSAISSSDVIIKVQDSNSGVQELGNICSEHLVSFKALPEFDFDFKLREFFPVQYDSPSLSRLVIPPQWEDVLSLLGSTEEVPSVLIRGPKNSGKSVFARVLVNRLLLKHKYVAYVDCDPGQTEFTPPGMVSLHVLSQPLLGPPFTHPRQPFKAHFVGSTSIRSSTSHFFACIDDLLESYRLDVKHTYELENDDRSIDSQDEQDEDDGLHQGTPKEIPLVINTFGWVKGAGADALYHIERKADLTHIVSLEPSSSDPVWVTQTHSHKRSAEVTHLSVLGFEHAKQDQNQANKRALMIMSYFHHEEIIEESRRQEQTRRRKQPLLTKWTTYKPLCARPPWEVRWDIALDNIMLIGSGAEDIVSSELLRVLNGAIVALVGVDLQGYGVSSSSSSSAQHQNRNQTQNQIPYKQGASPPIPNISNCLGLALVRSVRPADGTLHIITPIAQSLLAQCRTIVIGEIKLPVWGMLDHRPESKSAGKIGGVDSDLVPFLEWGKGPQGISGSKTLRVRRNLMRKGQA